MREVPSLIKWKKITSICKVQYLNQKRISWAKNSNPRLSLKTNILPKWNNKSKWNKKLVRKLMKNKKINHSLITKDLKEFTNPKTKSKLRKTLTNNRYFQRNLTQQKYLLKTTAIARRLRIQSNGNMKNKWKK